MVSNKEINKTFLSLDQAEQRGFIHRDYIAHCLRWSHVIHVIKSLHQSNSFKTAKILDIGCGKEVPLAKTMYTSKMSPLKYIGVDYNKIESCTLHEKMKEKFDFSVYGEFDFCENIVDGKLVLNGENVEFNPTTIVCFEVLEHMSPKMVIKTLKNMKSICTPETTIFVSTPCYNGEAAANHPNEMHYEVLGTLIEQTGFEITEMYGTFASQTDYKQELEKQYGEVGLGLFKKLSSYYDSNLVSVLFAPLFPDKSRNCLWKFKVKSNSEYVNRFKTLKELSQTLPWESWGNFDWKTIFAKKA